MSLVGKTALIVILLIGIIGIFQKAHAEGLLLFRTKISGKKPCSTLDDYLINNINSCEEQTLSQTENAIKSEVKTGDETPLAFSYSFETDIETPTPSPQPSIPLIADSKPLIPDATQAPEDNIPAEGVNLDSNLIFQLINQHRAEIGKPAFLHEDALCTLAQTRSTELHGELFEGKGYLHSGLYNRNLPYWITEDAKWGSNEAGTVQWWLHSQIHRAAIEGDYTYSCGACTGSMCSQLFTSYTPKHST